MIWIFLKRRLWNHKLVPGLIGGHIAHSYDVPKTLWNVSNARSSGTIGSGFEALQKDRAMTSEKSLCTYNNSTKFFYNYRLLSLQCRTRTLQHWQRCSLRVGCKPWVCHALAGVESEASGEAKKSVLLWMAYKEEAMRTQCHRSCGVVNVGTKGFYCAENDCCPSSLSLKDSIILPKATLAFRNMKMLKLWWMFSFFHLRFRTMWFICIEKFQSGYGQHYAISLLLS